MVRQTIRRMVEHWPEESIAFHGTPFRNVTSIKRQGLVPKNTIPYICPLPTRRYLESEIRAGRFGSSASELLERTIGSALFAGNYAIRQEVENPRAKVGDLPAILIFRGPPGWSFGAYDTEHQQQTAYYAKKHRSFGKVPEDPVPPESLVGVVRLTKKEHRDILRTAKGNNIRIWQLARANLALKALNAVKELVERGKLSLSQRFDID